MQIFQKKSAVTVHWEMNSHRPKIFAAVNQDETGTSSIVILSNVNGEVLQRHQEAVVEKQKRSENKLQ